MAQFYLFYYVATKSLALYLFYVNGFKAIRG